MDKMDHVNFVSIFDNLNLHVKPMDSLTKNGMDAKKDLEVHQKNGEEQKWVESIQKNSSSIQEKQPYFQRSQEMSKTNDIEGEWGHDHYNNPMGCSLLPVHDQYIFLKERSQETFSAPKSSLSMDDYNRTSTRKPASNSQHLLKIKSEKGYQPCILCIDYSSRLERQERIVPNLIKERPFSSEIWKCGSKTRIMGVRELLGDECLDLFMPVNTRSGNQVSNNISTQKNNNGSMQKLQSYSELVDKLKNDRKFREFCDLTDKWLIDQENREYFDKTYGITYIRPLLVDHSAMVVLFLDDREIMFIWSEMEFGMRILRINKAKGLANYLYHPEKICAVMEDTGELVTEVKLTRLVKENMAEKEKLA
ncbi:12624_t:CDS:2 [Funneliformis geosporum]|nr:12624_t:CDS:2 [Funneliformis geosporum]